MQFRQEKEKKPEVMKKMHLEGNPLNGFFSYLLLKKYANHGTIQPFQLRGRENLVLTYSLHKSKVIYRKLQVKDCGLK